MTRPARSVPAMRSPRKGPRRALRGSAPAAAGLLFAIALSACAAASAATQPLRVMTFNIEWGGTHVDFAQVVAAIRRAEPDVVVVQEAEGNLKRLAGELGWHYDRAHHVVSRLELIEPDADPRWLWVETGEGRGIAVANVHLPSDPYGEHRIRAGSPRDDVLALERRVRLPALQPILRSLAPLVAADVPVFLAGDFNSPSHLDWGPDALERWPERRYPMRWPVSLDVAAAGFRDTWREAHPDAVARTGFTWWAERPRIADYNPGPDTDWQSRIDFVHVAGPVRVTGARLVGERGAADLAVNPWPSDHRAVVVDTTVSPAPLPPYVVAERPSVPAGQPFALRYRNHSATGTLRIVGQGGDEASRIELKQTSGRLSQSLPAGRYRLELADAEGEAVAAYRLAVQAPGDRPRIAVDRERSAEGAPITLRWKNAPGNRYDWVAIYPAGAAEGAEWVDWQHTGASIDGMAVFRGTIERPLPAGRYVARLLEDDGQAVLAESVPFAIGPPDDVRARR